MKRPAGIAVAKQPARERSQCARAGHHGGDSLRVKHGSGSLYGWGAFAALEAAVKSNQLHSQPITGLCRFACKQFADEALRDANPLRYLRLGHARLSQLGNEVLPVHAPLLQAQSVLAIALAIAFGDRWCNINS